MNKFKLSLTIVTFCSNALPREINFKKILLIIFSLFYLTGSNLTAQQPTQEWVQRYPGDTSIANASAWGVKSDALGNVYVMIWGSYGAGFLKYDANGTLINNGNYSIAGHTTRAVAFDVRTNGDVYVACAVTYNSNEWLGLLKFTWGGLLQWAKLYNQDNSDFLYDMKVDRAGNPVLVGSSVISGTQYGLIVKYNFNGDTLWTKHFNNGTTGTFNSLCIDDTNNIYVAGGIVSGGPLVGAFLKYTQSGNLVWYTTDNDIEQGKGISLDAYGSIYSTGTRYIPPNGPNDYLLKLGNNGAVIWTRVFAGIINGQQGLGGTPIGPVVTYDGSSIYYTTDIYAGAGIHSIATLKYTASGDSAWIRAYNGGHFGGLNVPGDVKLDNFGNIYVCGLGNYQTTGDDIVTFKYNPAGQQLWLATYNGPLQNNGDYGHGLFIDSSLNVYVTGLSLRQNNTYNDAITIKYNQPVGITSGNMEIPTQYGLFQNYPNPFNSTTVINYQLPTQSTVKLVLFNLLGQVVETIVDQKQDAGYYSISVNLQNFSSGIYFYRLVAEGNIINTKKMIFVK